MEQSGFKPADEGGFKAMSGGWHRILARSNAQRGCLPRPWVRSCMARHLRVNAWPTRRPRSRRRSQRRRPPSGWPQSRPSSRAAILRSRRATATPRAGLHRRHAGLETRRRAPPRRAHRAHRPRRAQGRQMELAVLWRRGPGLVPQLPLLHEVREGGFLPRRVAASCSRPARPSRRTCATSTSTRTTSSTTLSSPPG